MFYQSPCICWGDDKDGGQGGPCRQFLGFFCRLHLLHLLLKTVQFPTEPGDGAIFGHIMLCAVAMLTCKVFSFQHPRHNKRVFFLGSGPVDLGGFDHQKYKNKNAQ